MNGKPRVINDLGSDIKNGPGRLVNGLSDKDGSASADVSSSNFSLVNLGTKHLGLKYKGNLISTT